MKVKIFTLILFLVLFYCFKDSISKNTFSDFIQKTDSIKINDSNTKFLNDTLKTGRIHIDTTKSNYIAVDTLQKNNTASLDSLYNLVKEKKSLTNTKLFIYIFLSLAGIILFFFLFVLSLFKVFHKTRSTRQSLLLSWNLFFVVMIIWIFIIWGILAGFWNSGAFLTVIIFLIILSLIMLIVAVKSK